MNTRVLYGRLNGGKRFVLNEATIAEIQRKVSLELIARTTGTQIPAEIVNLDIVGEGDMKYVLVIGDASDVAIRLESRETTKQGICVVAYREEKDIAAALYYDGDIKPGKKVAKAVMEVTKQVLGTGFQTVVSFYATAGRLVAIGTENLKNASTSFKEFLDRIGRAMFDMAGTLRGTRSDYSNLFFPFETDARRFIACWTPGNLLESWKVNAAGGNNTRHAFVPGKGLIEIDLGNGEVRVANLTDIAEGNANPWCRTATIRPGAENISEPIQQRLKGQPPTYLAFVHYPGKGKENPGYVELAIDQATLAVKASATKELQGDNIQGALVKVDPTTGITTHTDQNGGEIAFAFGTAAELKDMLPPEIIARAQTWGAAQNA